MPTRTNNCHHDHILAFPSVNMDILILQLKFKSQLATWTRTRCLHGHKVTINYIHRHSVATEVQLVFSSIVYQITFCLTACWLNEHSLLYTWWTLVWAEWVHYVSPLSTLCLLSLSLSSFSMCLLFYQNDFTCCIEFLHANFYWSKKK